MGVRVDRDGVISPSRGKAKGSHDDVTNCRGSPGCRATPLAILRNRTLKLSAGGRGADGAGGLVTEEGGRWFVFV